MNVHGSLRNSASPTDEATGQNQQPEIRIGKTVAPRDGEPLGVVAEVFTMTLGTETIQLLPLKNWSQLDLFKWRVRGILPGTPPGLEITFEHLKVAGETVTPWDPDGCAKLEKVLNEWLALERKALDSTVLKTQPEPQNAPSRPEEEGFHFRLEMDNAGKPRLRFMEGEETVKAVALNLQGFNALIEQGLMRKPQNLKVGAFHDWVELEGELFRLQGTDGAAALERRLNEAYIAAEQPDVPWDIAVFSNPASPTGFDIQFPASPTGIAENKKQHLNEESVELLQDSHKCSVLRRGVTARLIPPQLVFKLKTPDGGERSLEPGPETAVAVRNESGETKIIDLSQPVDLLRLNANQLATVLNHPAINKRARLAETARRKGPSNA